MRLQLATLLLILTAGCKDPAPTSAPPANASATTEPSPTEQVLAMPEGQRNAVFIRALRDAGQDCQHVDSSRTAGTYRGMPVWEATCRGGGRWTIVIFGDTAQILNADRDRLDVD